MSDTNSKIEKFNKYTNVRVFLDALNNGGIIRQAFGRFVQLYSVIIGYFFIKTWAGLFSWLEYLNFLQGFAAIIWQLFSLVAVLLCLKVIFLRGSDIVKLPDSDYTVSKILALFITMHGEVAFLFLGIMSVPATILVWLAGSSGMVPVPFGTGFLGGIYTFAGFLIIGFLTYCATRWIRESLIAIFSIAHNVDLIKRDKINGDS